jgi:hypothetical protein
MEVHDWLDTRQAERFLAAVRKVLNAHVYCVPLLTPRPIDASNLIATAHELLRDCALEGPLTAAVLEEDPGVAGAIFCSYTPPDNIHAVGISAMNEADARRRLAAMLLPRSPYMSPYARTTSSDEAAALVGAFLDAFTPRPTLFAEVDPVFLRGWVWIESDGPAQAFPDGFCDSAMMLAVGSTLALLINNGSD